MGVVLGIISWDLVAIAARFFFLWYIFNMKLKIKKLFDDAVLLTRAHHDDAGIDLYSYKDQTIEAHETIAISTGVAMEIEKGYVGLIWDKSSIGSKGLKTLGGVIDAGYRGEVKVLLHNLTDTPHTFLHGQKVAQLLIQKIELPEIEEVKGFSESTRGEGGFGSTGK